MRFRWKDFFYFQKGDRNAIIILLLLIMLSGLLVIHRESIFENQKSHLLDNEFDKFQNELEEESESQIEIEKVITSKNEIRPVPQIKKLVKGETIDLNSATVETLKRLPGIGEEYAKRIYNYRRQLGGFISVEQIKEVQGFSGKRFDNISSYLVIKKSHERIKINSHSSDKLSGHPYINEKQLNSIIENRGKDKKITTMDELLELAGFTPRDIDRLSAYISFE